VSTAVAEARTESAARPKSWRSLLNQPAAIVAVLIVFTIWLLTTELTPTESATLNPAALWGYTTEHLFLTFSAAVIVLAIAVPLGVILTRRPFRALTGPVLAIVNVGQSAPAIGLIVLLAFWLGFSQLTATVALILYALLPVLRNTMVGLDGVDQRLVEAGRGMGMSAAAVLFKVELPLAVPVMLAGIRTALVLLVGTAALAAFVNGGGLGLLITTGVNLYLPKVLITGAVLTALLALILDWLGGLVEHFARPKGV
jgi:osmoprotectant transport system permease protein